MFLMNLLREEFLVFMLPFAAAFSKPVWESAIALVVGAILTRFRSRQKGIGRDAATILFPNLK
ncbi:hypothetical protein [Calothrix sp. NIES-3974]|uniref:hypothetical protein n=1 Tax=Calothrix sp. NIES-3974 TaxID=2005462 RepID=UPI000BBC407C|nr:hypothetical protein [Calothrix sp. NIES-3974]